MPVRLRAAEAVRTRSPAATRFNRREQILAAATTLFCRHGYDGTAIRAIAKDCGITEAAIYRHFKGKAHLYEEVIRAKAVQHDIGAKLATLAGTGSVEDVLSGLARQILDLAVQDPELIRRLPSWVGTEAHSALEATVTHLGKRAIPAPPELPQP